MGPHQMLREAIEDAVRSAGVDLTDEEQHGIVQAVVNITEQVGWLGGGLGLMHSQGTHNLELTQGDDRHLRCSPLYVVAPSGRTVSP